jgi:hypothetical protein
MVSLFSKYSRIIGFPVRPEKNDAFKELYADKWITKKITTQDQFLKFVELKNAQIDKDTDKINQLKTELNLDQKEDWISNKTVKQNKNKDKQRRFNKNK